MTFRDAITYLAPIFTATLMCAFSTPAASDTIDGCDTAATPVGMNAGDAGAVPLPVAEAMWAWVAARMQVDVTLGPPSVCVLPPDMVAQIRNAKLGVSGPLELVAAYDREQGQVFLSAPWRPESPVDLSALAHEMAHHAQSVAGRRFACPQAAEAEPYALQEEWLKAFDSGLKEAFELDRMTLFILTVCGM